MSKNNKLNDAIKNAQDSVEELRISDPDLKKVAFEKAIDFFLNEDDKQKKANLYSSDAIEIQKETGNLQFWNNLQVNTSIPMEVLKDIYTFDEKKEVIYVIHLDIKGATKKGKQENVALLILLAYKFGLGSEWVSARDLKIAVDELNLYTPKFAQAMSDEKFRSKGTTKWKEYKLSLPGHKTAVQYLEELSGDDGEANSTKRLT